MDPTEQLSKTHLLPYLFSGYRPFVIMAIHTVTTALLFQSFHSFFLLLAWFLSFVAIQEPSIPRVARHEDVAEFMSSDVGKILTYRRFWVPKGERWWVLPLVAVLLLLPGIAFGLHKTGIRDLDPQKAYVIFCWCWAFIPLGIIWAFLVENILHIPPVYGPLALFYIVFLTIFAVKGKEEKVTKFLIAIPVVIIPLYCLDLMRVLRRAWFE